MPKGYIHGGWGTPTYKIWEKMLARCRNQNNKGYPRYGGRGITVCERWADFSNFLADMGERPEGLSLDRINVNGNYEPGNCRWATAKEQALNRRDNVRVVYEGREMTVREAADLSGLGYMTIRSRMKRGWPESDWFVRPQTPNEQYSRFTPLAERERGTG